MAKRTYNENWYDIDTQLYNKTGTVFRSVKKMLGVNMKLHADENALAGDIFLFNHFARFETFIPQFLIYERTGAYSCAIASGEFFTVTPGIGWALRIPLFFSKSGINRSRV